MKDSTLLVLEKALLVLAWADGHLSAEEKETIATFYTAYLQRLRLF